MQLRELSQNGDTQVSIQPCSTLPVVFAGGVQEGVVTNEVEGGTNEEEVDTTKEEVPVTEEEDPGCVLWCWGLLVWVAASAALLLLLGKGI